MLSTTLRNALIVIGLVLALRLPFLHQAIQGDDIVYLAGAEHAQIEPLHPYHVKYVFRGEPVDMRGQSHPPLDSWILAGLLATFGDIREVPFHLVYIVFSLTAALAMLALAQRFSDRPLLATVLFLVVPAFVVNGTSLETDIPFVAFWLAAMACFVYAVDRDSLPLLLASILAAALAALTSYQGVFITPILALYLYQQRRRWWPGWIATLAAPFAIGSLQLFERLTSGAIPAAVLAGYMRSYHFEALAANARGAAALVVHLAWIVSPLIVLALFPKARRQTWIIAALAAGAAAIYDPNPLFWVSFGLGIWILRWCFEQGFLGWWVLLFFAPAAVVFFAGSARYLLPVAAPLAILASNAAPRAIAIAGIALQLALSLGLAVVNAQFWDGYRSFAAEVAQKAAGRRIWINADWGLRYYLESAGGLPLTKDPHVRPGDVVVTSELAGPLSPGTPLTPLATAVIRPEIPLRLIALDGRSAYSYGSHGLLPFEISTGPIDRVRAEIAVEPSLPYIDPHDPHAAAQFISGLSADGWTEKDATVLVKVPPGATTLSASFFVFQSSPARHASLSANGQVLVEKDLPAPNASYTISAPAPPGESSLAVTLSVDKTFTAPGDARHLGVILTGIGFK